MNLLERIETIERLQAALGKELQEKQHEYLSSKGWVIKSISGVSNAFTYDNNNMSVLTCDIDSAMEKSDDRPTCI